ncbi:hypothetical protein C2857_002041 [Epichloe festucae Fl1]|uniref:Malate dehydrogenase n=1 Tax=Epichloe festucae (strain Fl1) TaxID=877507 RepID=A0A7S9KUF1_EPIFF|nr:hypothetical protein C2857_002041 [Epichloe festucae Fl1]
MFKSTCVLLLPAALVLVLGLPSASCAPGHKAPALPHIHGAANLPQPPAGSKLLHIALGFGIQNYTCAGVGEPPAATGALAVLYDITSLYPGQTRESLSQKDWDHLPSRALWSHEVPLNLNHSAAGRVERTSPGASQTRPFPAEAPLRLRGMRRPLPFLGHHLFTSAGVPNFILDNGRVNVLCGKMAGVSAPRAADRGPQGTGAVPWLQLDAKDGSVGRVKYVYRVLTTGGNSHGCSEVAGQDSTCYATMYWFFG